ncbi:hypothetical protein MBANPS3_010001 [Mucor bainieri]
MSDSLPELANAYQNLVRENQWKCLQEYAGIQSVEAIKVPNILLLVIDVSFRSTKKDDMFNLVVTDPSLSEDDGFTCLFFINESDKAMPDIKVGNMVMLRNAAVLEYNSKPQLTKNKYTEFAVFDQDAESCSYSSSGFYWEADDEEVYRAFCAWNQAVRMRNGFSPRPQPMIRSRRPFLTTDQILVNNAKYFNYVGMIVGFFDQYGNHSNRKREIKLTDFTINPKPLPRDHMADDGTIGNVTNDMTLLCTLFDDHSECGPFRFGDYVFLDNCTRNLKNTMQLEIRVSWNPNDHIHVTRLEADDPRLQPLLQRQREYEASFNQSASQIPETATNMMRSRIPGVQAHVSIEQLLAKEGPGIEYIRVTIENQRPSELTTWLKNYCARCKTTSVPTISEELDPCSKCDNMTKPVYRAMFKVRDEEGTELAVLAMDEEADKLFKDLPARRLKRDATLWGDFKKYINYSQQDSKGKKPYFSLGVKKYFNHNGQQDGWMYSIVNTEFILEDGRSSQ